MSYSINILENSSFRKLVELKRSDGQWKDSPFFNCVVQNIRYLDTIRDFEVYEDDIWLLGYFKTGSTLTKELVWLLNNDLDFDRAKNEILSKRFRYFE